MVVGTGTKLRVSGVPSSGQGSVVKGDGGGGDDTTR